MFIEKQCSTCDKALSIAAAYEQGYSDLSPEEYSKDASIPHNSWYCKLRDEIKSAEDYCERWESFQ